MSDFWSDPLSTILHVCEQRRLWQDCPDAQARLSLRWSLRGLNQNPPRAVLRYSNYRMGLAGMPSMPAGPSTTRASTTTATTATPVGSPQSPGTTTTASTGDTTTTTSTTTTTTTGSTLPQTPGGFDPTTNLMSQLFNMMSQGNAVRQIALHF